jgi:sulfur-carrier protein
MQFNLYATFRLIAGVKTLEIELPEGTTVRQAVDALVAERPVLRQHWLDGDGDIHAHVHIFVSGEDARNLAQGFDSPLPKDAVLEVFPPVGGGGFPAQEAG